MKQILKCACDFTAWLIVLPCIIMTKLEAMFFKNKEGVFVFWGQALAVAPGILGVFLRRSYYASVLQHCSRHVHIGFGVLFSHRNVIIADDVYVGPYSLIGTVHIGQGCFIGSRVSLLSGKRQHERKDGRWQAADVRRFTQICIHENVWLGEGAIIMADVGTGSLVAAGAVVTDVVADNVVVAGNPATTCKELS